MANRNISCGEAILMILAGILVFFLVLVPGFRVIDTIVETLIPSEDTILRWIAERVLFIMAMGGIIGILCIPARIAAYRERRKKAGECSWHENQSR